jgi:hypothetical protein
MTEFWVSKAKYYCKTCKIWMADNKMSRQMHESSGKHRDLVQREAQLKKDTKLHGARSDAELQRTLAEINKAAHAAVASDRDTGGAAHATMFAAVSQPLNAVSACLCPRLLLFLWLDMIVVQFYSEQI